MATTSAVRRGLADQVYDQLKEQLFEGRFGLDAWLPVEEIATEMDVSRQPVMDALKRLAIDGFVTIVPQVGCRVRAYTGGEIRDFYLLFAFAESFVAELAATRATTEDVLSLRMISDRIGQLARQRAAGQELARLYRGLNRLLHKEIRRIARSAPVTEIVESMGDRSDFFIATSSRPFFAETLRDAHGEHQAVVDAIEKKDGKAAGRTMRQHIIETDLRLQRFLGPGVEPPPAAPRRLARTRG